MFSWNSVSGPINWNELIAFHWNILYLRQIRVDDSFSKLLSFFQRSFCLIIFNSQDQMTAFNKSKGVMVWKQCRRCYVGSLVVGTTWHEEALLFYEQQAS